MPQAGNPGQSQSLCIPPGMSAHTYPLEPQLPVLMHDVNERITPSCLAGMNIRDRESDFFLVVEVREPLVPVQLKLIRQADLPHADRKLCALLRFDG